MPTERQACYIYFQMKIIRYLCTFNQQKDNEYGGNHIHAK